MTDPTTEQIERMNKLCADACGVEVVPELFMVKAQPGLIGFSIGPTYSIQKLVLAIDGVTIWNPYENFEQAEMVMGGGYRIMRTKQASGDYYYSIAAEDWPFVGHAWCETNDGTPAAICLCFTEAIMRGVEAVARAMEKGAR